MNATSLVSFAWALVFVAGNTLLSVQLGHAQGNLPPVTGGQPQTSKLVAADNCCGSGSAQMVLMSTAPVTTKVNYGRDLARYWNANLFPQQKAIRTKLGDIALLPLLSKAHPSSPSLSVSVDPQKKFLKVSLRLRNNRLQRLTAWCATFDVEAAMVFRVSGEVAVLSSEVKTSNVVPTAVLCSNFQSIVERLESKVFPDAGTAMKLADSFNRFLLRAAKDNGIRDVTPGVPRDNPQLLTFEITPVALPTRGVQ